MSLTEMADPEVAPARRRLAARPWRRRRLWAEYAWTVSACAHSGARRAARSGRWDSGAIGETHPSDRAHLAATSGRQPQPRFSPGGPALLTEDRQKPRSRLDGMHGTRNTVPSIAVVVVGKRRRSMSD